MDELEFAQRLKRYRRERGLTQQELADRIGVSNKSPGGRAGATRMSLPCSLWPGHWM